jgi:hypothetical protein
MKQLITLLAVFFSATVFAQNVGIGETSPTDTRLQVKRADSALLLLHNPSTGSDVKTGMFFKSGNSYSGSIITTGNTAAQTFRMGFSTFGSPTPSGLVERISINDIGNVGIGNINPTTKLDINGQIKISGGSPAVGRILESDATGLATWVDKPGGVLPAGVSGNTIRHNGTSFIATSNLYNDGTRIGIGTTTPGSMLEIKPATGTADIELNASTGDNAVLRLNRNSISSGAVIRFKTAGVNKWDIGTNFDENFKLKFVPNNETVLDIDDATRNIGIGTSDYSEKINVNGNVAAYGAFISKFSNAGFQFQDRSANAYGGWNWYADAGKANLYRYGSGGDVLTINQTGNVGIGTTTPTTAGLVVNKVVGNTNAVFGSNTTGVSIQTSYPGIGFNTYYNGGSVMIANGGAGYIGADPTTGRIIIANTNANSTAGAYNALQDKMWIANDGTVSLGSSNLNTENTSLGAGYKLKVFGKIVSEEVRVQIKSAWPDYVFEKSYKKLSLEELEKYIHTNKHLPNIPSATEIEKDGQHLGEIQRKMLEKIEELSLYIIELKKEIDLLKEKK